MDGGKPLWVNTVRTRIERTSLPRLKALRLERLALFENSRMYRHRALCLSLKKSIVNG
jgi:hypothetical protein